MVFERSQAQFDILEYFYVYNIGIFSVILCQAKSHIGPNATLIQLIFQFQNRQPFIKRLTKLI